MQWLLGRLKGRLGVAIVLALVVLAAIGLGRALGRDGSGAGSTLPPLGAGSRTAPEIDTSTEDDGVEGLPTSPRPATPASLAPGAAPALDVARDFLAAWLRSELDAGQWHAGIRRYATDALAAKLSGVDPAGVPARRLTDDPALVPRGVGTAAVTVPVDSGKIELRMVVSGGRWLVDGVDWSRG